MDGRSDLFEGISNIFESLGKIIEAVKEAFRDVFPEKTSEELANLTKRFKNFTETLKPSEETLEKIGSIFRGLFSILKIVIEGAKGFINVVKNIATALKPVGEAIFDAAAALGDWISGITESVKATGSFEKIGEAVKNVFGVIGDAIAWAVQKIREFFGVFVKKDVDSLKENAEGIAEATGPLITFGEVLDKLGKGIKITWDKIKEILSSAWVFIKKLLTKVKEGLEYFFGDLKFDTFVHVIKELLGLGILNGFRKIVDGIGNGAQGIGKAFENLSGFFENLKKAGKEITGIFSDIRDVIGTYKKQKTAEILKTVGVSLLMVAGALWIISSIDSDKLSSSMLAITVLLGELIGSLALVAKIAKGDSIKNLVKLSTTMIAFSIAVLLLASALKKLSAIDPVQAWSSIMELTVLIAELVVAMRLLTTDGSKSIMKGAAMLISLGIAINLMVRAVKQFDGVDWPSMFKGLLGVFTLCMLLVASVNMMDGKIGLSGGLGIVLLASSLLIMASAVKKLGELDIVTLAKGLLFLAGGLMAMVVAINALPSATILKSIGVVIIASSLLILGEAIKNIGELDLGTLAKGILFLAGGLMAIVVALNAIPSLAIAKGIAITIVAASLLILGKAIKDIGELDLGTLGKGMGFIALGLLAIVAALFATSNPMALAGAAAILVVSAALVVLAKALKITSSIGFWETIGGLLSLVALLAIVGVGSALLLPLAPAILAVSAALAAFGAATLILLAPLALLVELMKSLVEWGPTGVQALTDFIVKLIMLIPEAIKALALGIVEIAKVIINSAPTLLEAFIVIFRSLVIAITTVIPEAVEAIITLIDSTLRAIADHLPSIIQSGWEITAALLHGIADHVQEMVEIGTDMIVNFIKGIEESIPRLVDEAFNLILVFIDTLGTTIRDKTPILIDHVWDMAENICIGLWEGLEHFFNKGKEKLTNFGQWIIDTLKKVFGIDLNAIGQGAKEFFDMGGQIITGMINGFKEGLNAIGKAVEEVGENIKQGFCNFFHINSPSKLMRDEVGNYIVEGIAVGIKENTSAEEAARIKAQNIANAFKDEINKIDLTQTTKDLELKLWNSKYGDDATDIEYAGMQLQNTRQYVENLEKKQELAKREYEITSETLGPESEEAIKAYQSYLQAQIDLLDKTKEYNSQLEEYDQIQKDYVQSQKDLEDSYYKYIITNGKTLKQLGYTNDQIQKAAKQATGFDPLASQPKMEDKVKEATLNSMQAVNTVYQENAENTFGALEPEFESYGEKYGSNLADGLESQSGLVAAQTTKLSDTSLDVLKDNKDDYYQAGLEAGKAYSSGLAYYANSVLNTDNGINSKTNSQLKAAYAAKNSSMQSKYSNAIKDIAAKEGVDMGVAYDMLKANARGGSYGSGTGYDKTELENDYKELAALSESLAVDSVSKVIKEGGDLSGLSTRKATISSSTSSSTAKSVSSTKSSSSSSSSSNSSSSSGTTVNVTQNNYSPKAISTTEVYRQVKTLISSVSNTIGGQVVASTVKGVASKMRCFYII